MIQNAEEVIQKIKAGEVSPIYFAFGDESYYLDLFAEVLEHDIIPEASKAFALTIVYGKDASLNDIIGTSRGFPMMSDRQVVLVKEAQDIKSWSSDDSKKLLEAYLSNPQASTVLAFIYKHKKFDKRTTWAKMLGKYAVLLESKKIYDNQVPTWVTKHIKQKGFESDPKAIQVISENIGNNLERLAGELNKLFINLKLGDRITLPLVENFIGISKDYNIFELQQALALRDSLKAYKIIQYFSMNTRDNPIIPALAVLYSWLTKILQIKVKKYTSDRDIAANMGINPYIAREYVVAARNYSTPHLLHGIQLVHEADLKIKGIQGNYKEKDIWLDLITGLLGKE